VLGFLSALVLMAVAFAIIMRTERLASRNYMDVVKARQLVHTAMAHIMANEIRTNMEDQVYPYWDAWPYDAGGNGEEFILSGGSNYVPWGVKVAADEADVSPMRWYRLDDAGNGEFVGKYAYMVVNNSGLLDANFVRGRNKPRRYGFDPGEIRATPAVLPELRSDSLYLYQETYNRFESVAELYWLGQNNAAVDTNGNGIAQLLNRRAGGFSGTGHFVDNFHVYSRFPRGYADPDDLLANTNVAYIGGNPADWNINSVSNALKDLFDEPTDPIPNFTAFYNALYDYADGSYVSRNPALNTYSSKAVPMINEVIVSNQFRLVAQGTNQLLEHFLYLTVETWYPFPEDTQEGAQFQVTYSGVPQVTVLPIAFTAPLALQSTPPAIQHGDYDFETSTFIFNHSAVVNGSGSPAYPPAQLGVRCVLNGTLEVQYLGAAVDRVNTGWPINTFQVIAAAPALALGGALVRLGEPAASSANDPRINWDPSASASPLQWDRVAATQGTNNTSRLNGPADEIGLMYARSLEHSTNGIQSVGEVGFLLYDAAKPWTTVRLLGPDPDRTARVLDRLTVHTNAVRQGLVNINTRQTNALTALFYDMSMTNTPPRATGSGQLELDQAKALAEYTVEQNQTWGEGPMVNYSDIAERWDQTAVAGVLGIPSTNKFFVESVVRNSIGLWGTRNNLFTVIVAARVFSDNYDPDNPPANEEDYVVAEQRALAILWRDPFLSSRSAFSTRPSNENFVRFFHWLLMDLKEPDAIIP